MILSDTIIVMKFLLFRTLPEFNENTFYVPCIFPVGPIAIYSWFLGSIFLFMFGSSRASTYKPTTTLQLFLKSKCSPVNIFLVEYFWETPLPSGSTFNHITINYTRWMKICDGRQEYGSVLKIPLPQSFNVMIVLHPSPTCSLAAALLTLTFPSISDTL